jgi:hypothetical protein
MFPLVRVQKVLGPPSVRGSPSRNEGWFGPGGTLQTLILLFCLLLSVCGASLHTHGRFLSPHTNLNSAFVAYVNLISRFWFNKGCIFG